MDGAVLTVIGKDKYVSFEIGPGRFNELDERGSSKTLILCRAEFLQAVLETLPEWYRVVLPPVFRPAHEVMRQVRFESDPDGPHANPADIPLGASAVIRHRRTTIGVLLPLEDFVTAAVTHLAERPIIDLGHRIREHQEAFKRAWAEAIIKLESPATWVTGI